MRTRFTLALAVSLLLTLAVAATAYAAVGAIEGTVTDADTHVGIEHVNVIAWFWNGGGFFFSAAVQTDPSGHFAIQNVSPADYMIQYTDTQGRYATRYWPNHPYQDSPIPTMTVVSAATSTVDATMVPSTVFDIRLVTDATGGPVASTVGGRARDTRYLGDFGSATSADFSTGLRILHNLEAGDFWQVRGDLAFGYRQRYWLAPNGSDLFDAPPNATATVNIAMRHDPAQYKDVVRLSGLTRYETALELAKEAAPGWRGVTDVIICSGENASLVDALSASGLAGAYDAPLLLVHKTYVPTLVMSALAAMPDGLKVHIVGGTPTVDPAVETSIGALANVASVDRCAGPDRYATAAQVAVWMRDKLGGTLPGTAFIANGQQPAHFYDALAFSPLAYRNHYPILLVKQASVPSTTSATLANLGLSTRYIGGDTAAVAASVATTLGVPSGNRLYGGTRYSTAAAIAEEAMESGWVVPNYEYGIATTLPDALAGGATIGGKQGIMLLTTPGATTLNPQTMSFLMSSGVRPNLGVGYVCGGANLVPDSVRMDAMDVLN